MTHKQLLKIRDFAKKYYKDTDQYHDWSHILLTRKYALLLAKKFKEADTAVIEAACYLHDIGRVVKDEGHPKESVKTATPFLKEIGLNTQEIFKINDAVLHHGKENILSSKTIEAKILFDADKLQILTIFGFLRVSFWLIDERGMEMNEAVDFLWNYIKTVRKKYLQTEQAKKIVDKEVNIIRKVVMSFKNWQKLE